MQSDRPEVVDEPTIDSTTESTVDSMPINMRPSITRVKQLTIPRARLQLTTPLYRSIKQSVSSNKQYVYDKLALIQEQHWKHIQSVNQSINQPMDQSPKQSDEANNVLFDETVVVQKSAMNDVQIDDLLRSPFASLPQCDVEIINGIYDYRDAMTSINRSNNRSKTVLFAVNFADPDLFGFWRSSLLAQDELQCLEFPELAMVQAFISDSNDRISLHRRGAESALVWPVWRYADVDCDRLYGGAFGRATRQQLDQHIRLLDDVMNTSDESNTQPTEPTDNQSNDQSVNQSNNQPNNQINNQSNHQPVACGILAIAALCGRSGFYTRADIVQMLATAYTAFESTTLFVNDVQKGLQKRASPPSPVIATGYWGCGAFGGSRPLMTAIQIIASRAAGVKLQFFASDVKDARHGLELVKSMSQINTIDECVEKLIEMKFRWGMSNVT